jgi:MarR family multiple antibiotic resistance transcriptional regulator
MAHFTPESFNESFLGMLLGRTEQLKKPHPR